ncbi:hypothetical protein CHS0354_031535 [Potamilus streckersoni]|uniref:Phosphoenolpyruvate synthase n=1 Tax=Potamilus streckersoni TaxID=2493646 RepID=A0AAE0SHW3_9BIVA|nr:hypothetical protein CHS0354_031535 [Potamilus streckersoni]
MLWTLVFAPIILFLLWDILRPDPPPVDGVYRLPGRCYYLKKYSFFLLLWLRKNRSQKRSVKGHVTEDHVSRGYGMSTSDPLQLEQCHDLEDDPHALDSAYFAGFGKDGTRIALRVARRHGREAEVWVLLEVPGLGFYQHPVHPDTCFYNTDGVSFTAGGVKLQLLEPLRRWKVSFSGMLRHGLCNTLDAKPDKYAHVKMTFIWEAVCDPFNFDVDLEMTSLADGIAKEKWSREFWSRLQRMHQTHYEQWGEMWGKICIEGHEERNVRLKSIRDHSFGVRDWRLFYRYMVHYIFVEETGIMAMVSVVSQPVNMSHIKPGYLVYANGETVGVSSNNLKIWDHTRSKEPDNNYSFSFTAGGEQFHVEVEGGSTPVLYHHADRGSKIFERFCKYKVNGEKAIGLVEFHYRNPEGPPYATLEKSVPLLSEPELTDTDREMVNLTLDFRTKSCGSSLLVGGKGAQLALLTSIQDKINAVVPRGFCVTLSAFEKQVQEQNELDRSIQVLTAAVRSKDFSNLPGICSDVVEQFASLSICSSVHAAILSQLLETFEDGYQNVMLAVRSSAADEDHGDASSAGQMETYLGVKGQAEVFEAVRKCWASAYSYQAVEYRRQHGQPIKTCVGVVIQEMVQSEIAGVMFTHDPVTANQNIMVIDAAYGLGEVVVSGKTVPDTIRVEHPWEGELKIIEKSVGAKSLQVNASDSGHGVQEVTVHKDSADTCCLTDLQIVHLCHIGIKIEQYYGNARDIEWAIKSDTVYILQARPITTLDQETDEELVHEFDTPVVSDSERLIQGNIGEMMPGCVTPLTMTTFARAINDATSMYITNMGGNYHVRNTNRFVQACCGQLFLNLTIIGQHSLSSLIGQKEAMEMNLVGAVLDDHKLSMIMTYGRKPKSLLLRIYHFIKCLKHDNEASRVADLWAEKLDHYSVGQNCDNASDLYQAIDSQLPDYYDVWTTTLVKSARSGIWGQVVMGIVSGGKPEWTVDNYADVALLLSKCGGVYSAEVPTAMQDLAKSIFNNGIAEDFLTMTNKECVQFLTSEECPQEVRHKYGTFIKRHGHRCIREAEFITKSWKREPENLIHILKTILKTKAYEHEQQEGISIKETMSKLKSPVSFFGRFLLKKFIVHKACKAVGEREWGKSTAIKMVDKFKEAYWKLAELMVLEGRLPEVELLFFLTQEEIGKLIQTRSAKLIAKSVRRRKIFHLQEEIQFPKMTVGIPVPIKKDDQQNERKTKFTFKGMPVSQGSVKGHARVVLSLEEANKIQKGEILIVCYTDVGWSPYFPLISGLVTEMGGLISHGAVVAREYGLPCIVNVPQATHLIQSGDLVHIDCSLGLIHKLEDQTVENQDIVGEE